MPKNLEMIRTEADSAPENTETAPKTPESPGMIRAEGDSRDTVREEDCRSIITMSVRYMHSIWAGGEQKYTEQLAEDMMDAAAAVKRNIKTIQEIRRRKQQ